jgi:hypothetical protein
VKSPSDRGRARRGWVRLCWFRPFNPESVCLAILIISGLSAGLGFLLPGHELRAEAGLARPTRAAPESNPSVEYQVKAAFLLNFTRFVEWPLNISKAPINLCLFKDDPFGNALDEVIRGKTINGHELLVHRINDLPGLKACQLVFVSNSEDKYLPEVLESLKGVSALVVGESEDFAERGGGLQFYLEDHKVRFCANVDALQRAGLNVSSKLLALARIVHDGGHPKGA